MTGEPPTVPGGPADPPLPDPPVPDPAAAFQPELTRRLARLAGRRGDIELGPVEPLSGGASGLSYLVTVTSRTKAVSRWVVRVAPPGLRPVGNRDIARQAVLLRALDWHRDIAVPHVVLVDDGDPPAVPPLMVTEFLPGECVEPVLEEGRDPALVAEYRNRGLDAARVLAALHRVDPRSVGLDDEPVPLLHEVVRWTRALETVPPELCPGYADVARALTAAVPEPLGPAILHGDYRLGNLLCENGRVAGVIDWELWAVGDPRFDLAWMMFFGDGADHPGAPSAEPTGVPTPEQTVAAYAAAGGRPAADLTWFEAVTMYKEVATTALLAKRTLKSGAAPPPVMRRMISRLPELMWRARELAGEL